MVFLFSMHIETPQEHLPNQRFEKREGERIVLETLRDMGLSKEQLSETLFARLMQMENESDFLLFERQAIRYADQVFVREPDIFSEEEKRRVKIGTLFSDIGKTGPVHASTEEGRLILAMFNIHNVPKEEHGRPVTDFLAKHFSPDTVSSWKQFAARHDFDDDLTLRQFWDLHTHWTFDLLNQSDAGIPREAIPGAVLHHALRGIDTEQLLDENTGELQGDFGRVKRFGQPEKLVILLDLYDAYRNRGAQGKSRPSHADTMAYLQDMVEKNKTYAHDADFAELLQGMQEAFSS